MIRSELKKQELYIFGDHIISEISNISNQQITKIEDFAKQSGLNISHKDIKDHGLWHVLRKWKNVELIYDLWSIFNPSCKTEMMIINSYRYDNLKKSHKLNQIEKAEIIILSNFGFSWDSNGAELKIIDQEHTFRYDFKESWYLDSYLKLQETCYNALRKENDVYGASERLYPELYKELMNNKWFKRWTSDIIYNGAHMNKAGSLFQSYDWWSKNIDLIEPVLNSVIFTTWLTFASSQSLKIIIFMMYGVNRTVNEYKIKGRRFEEYWNFFNRWSITLDRHVSKKEVELLSENCNNYLITNDTIIPNIGISFLIEETLGDFNFKSIVDPLNPNYHMIKKCCFINKDTICLLLALIYPKASFTVIYYEKNAHYLVFYELMGVKYIVDFTYSEYFIINKLMNSESTIVYDKYSSIQVINKLWSVSNFCIINHQNIECDCHHLINTI